MRGYTIIEVLVIVAMILVLVMAVFAAIRSGDPNVSCDVYSSYPMKDVPARCIQYFEGN